MTDRRATLLRSLAERVEAGEKNTMALSEEIYRAAGLACGEHHYLLPGDIIAWFMRDLVRSIDAQDALGVRIISVLWVPVRRVYRVEAMTEEGITGQSIAPTEPAARLAAILRALASREEA